MIGRAGQFLSLIVRASYSFILACTVALSLYSVCDLWYLYGKAAQKSGVADHKQTKESADYPDKWPDRCVARISLEGTDIDYPVMQAQDNTTYLNLDENGDYSLSGSIFLDCRCSPDFNDGYSLIYGHHMEYGLMFGALDKFQSEGYFDAHRRGTLTFADGRSERLRTIAVAEVLPECPEIFVLPFTGSADGGDFQIAMEWIRRHSLLYRGGSEDTGSQIIALSTCSGQEGSRREILFLVPER